MSTNHPPLYAHTAGLPEPANWELLPVHLAEVGALTAEFAAQFGAETLGMAAGLLHDAGKASPEFQAMLRGGPSPDHSTAGAVTAVELYGVDDLGRLLAFCIAGHHAGLADGRGEDGPTTSLERRLAKKAELPDYRRWQEQIEHLLPGQDALDLPFDNDDRSGFDLAFLTRMLFSCLVDADTIATRRFEARALGQEPPREPGWAVRPEHLEQVRRHMAEFEGKPGFVNAVRARILDHIRSKAAEAPGLFTLTVPTGGGKTLASLDFALDHALRWGKRRVIYVIPFTSIIEQTADVFRHALGEHAGDVLEHHSSFDWDAAKAIARADDERARGLAELERAAENWDAPIVVSTAVQFFESLFAARRGRCRKLHNLANSVIVLDEAQKLPVPLLRPCMAALHELAEHYGATVVLCTATQPALARQDGALPVVGRERIGLNIPPGHELAPDPARLYDELRRVAVKWRREPIDDEGLAGVFAEVPRLLCIVNSRAHARDLFELLRGRDLEGAYHLTTLMCVAHRRAVLAEIRAKLLDPARPPVRLVSTSLVEAGVDVDFPEVWRAAAGLDSIAQAAGRCNREGRLDGHGRVVVFETPPGRAIPRDLKLFWQAAREPLQMHDPLGLAAVKRYFEKLYDFKDAEGLDAATVLGRRGILRAIADRADTLDFPFASVAAAFRMIEQHTVPLIVPWDGRAKAVIAQLCQPERPITRDLLRTLQQYTVPISPANRAQLLADGAAEVIGNKRDGDPFVALPDLAMYDPKLGFMPRDRTAESNIFG